MSAPNQIENEPSGDDLRAEGDRFATSADVEEVGNPGGNEGDEREYVTQQWALQDKDPDPEPEQEPEPDPRYDRNDDEE